MKSIRHSSPPIRRGVVLSAVVVLGLGSFATGALGATTVNRAAVVDAPAVRVAIADDDRYPFPIQTQPRCENLDNYGGDSKQFGSGAHQGVDIGAERGQEVYAVTDGVLYRQWTDLDRPPGLGWGLHGFDDTKFRYFHLDGFAEGLEVGDVVEQGQLIGYVGDTGNAAPGGWHLHFEIRPGPAPHRTTVDPNSRLRIPGDCIVYWR